MVRITFIDASGAQHQAEGPEGQSVMETAIKGGVSGIDADCGGACSCATCHVSVDPNWFERVGAPGEVEETMLDFAPVRTPTSRLSCQIKLAPNLDGLVVHLPETQR
jgi:ferredoxin, 2Fe-2S